MRIWEIKINQCLHNALQLHDFLPQIQLLKCIRDVLELYRLFTDNASMKDLAVVKKLDVSLSQSVLYYTGENHSFFLEVEPFFAIAD